MKISNPNLLKSQLTVSSLYITGYEFLKNSIIEKLKGLICSNSKLSNEGKLIFIENSDYKKIKNKKHTALEGNSNEFYSCCEWYMDRGIISTFEFDELQKIRKFRNDIAHRLPELLIDDSKTFEIELFNSLLKFISKIEKYWVLEFEIPINPDYDNKEINEDEVSTGVIILMEYLVNIAKEEIENIKKSS